MKYVVDAFLEKDGHIIKEKTGRTIALKGISRILYEFSYKMLGEHDVIIEDSQMDLPALVEQARKDWLAALSFFDNVSEKELVDQAIYHLNAAERRYVFLLSEVKKERDSEASWGKRD